MSILINILILSGGVVLLLAGGEFLVRGAVTLAGRMGVSTLVIGLTVVAFGTSAPELAFNVTASINDHNELSLGNIVGSNIANIGLILGLAALLKPLKVNSSVIRREMPVMIGATALMVVLAALPIEDRSLSRVDGIILLAFFAGLSSFALIAATRSRRGEDWGETFESDIEEVSERDRRRPAWLALLLVLVGLGMLGAGVRLAETGAVGIAVDLNLSRTLIGLTIVALATSLPELATSLIAVRRGQVDIAVGNVVGSNIFNILLVLGTTAVVRPVECGDASIESFAVMGFLAAVLWFPISRTAGQRVSRLEGLFLLLVYLAYMAYEVITL
ncbi:MAG: calcium/sodium antiporter [Phycisphaerales bacterium]|nr:calcium/sodium antiporter [Phycisphaerales bacterium]